MVKSISGTRHILREVPDDCAQWEYDTAGANNMTFIGYRKCSTSNRAQSWLDAHGISYEFRDIRENNPKLDELKEWALKSGQPLKSLFNTSGMLYREMGLKGRISSMSNEELLCLLSENGMLVKRPVIVSEGFVMFGFKEDKWGTALIH